MWNAKDEPGEDQIAVLRRMTYSQRLEAAAMLYRSARELKRAHLKQQHPDWPESELKRAVNEAFMYARD